MSHMGIADWRIAGLPVHALIVHFAVVLVPLAALGLLAIGWRASWRRKYSWLVALLAVGGAVAAVVAVQSGEALERSERVAARTTGIQARFGDHPSEGQSAETMALIFAVTAILVWAVDRWGHRLHLPRWSPLAAYAVAVAPALLSIVLLIAAGHSGAALVWRDLGTFVNAP